MEGLIKFGHEIIGLGEFEAFIFICLIVIVRLIYKRYSNYQATKLDILTIIISEFSNKEQNNRDFIIEQILERKYGKVIDYPIIEFFMKKRSPSRYLNEYILACDFIEFSDNYRKKYFKKFISNKVLYFYILFLMVVYLLFFSILIYFLTSEIISTIDTVSKAIIFGFVISTCILAIFVALTASRKPHAAIRLIDEFGDKHAEK